MLFFDRQVYMVFTPGQMRVCLEIGDAETAYDTAGMTIQKQRSDLFTLRRIEFCAFPRVKANLFQFIFSEIDPPFRTQG